MKKHLLLTLGVGVLAGLFRVVYVFFPGLNVMDVMVFGGLSGILASIRPRRWWFGSGLLIAPAMMFVVFTLFQLGTENLRRGIGTGHAISAVLIPLTALIGGVIGSVIGTRRLAH